MNGLDLHSCSLSPFRLENDLSSSVAFSFMFVIMTVMVMSLMAVSVMFVSIMIVSVMVVVMSLMFFVIVIVILVVMVVMVMVMDFFTFVGMIMAGMISTASHKEDCAADKQYRYDSFSHNQNQIYYKSTLNSLQPGCKMPPTKKESVHTDALS